MFQLKTMMSLPAPAAVAPARRQVARAPAAPTVEPAEWELVDAPAPAGKKAAKGGAHAKGVTSGTRNKADIVAVMGASGTGKSSYIKGELLRNYRRLYIWSPLEETDQYASFCNGVVVTKITEFIAHLKAGTRAVVFVPTGSDAQVKKLFDLFCRAVWEVKDSHVLVEELSRVTMPSWAPPAWKNLCTAGRHKGLTLIGTSQRPADVDKAFFGNCTEVRCYRLNYDQDAKVMADCLNLQTIYEPAQGGRARQIKPYQQLRTLQNFHFFHKNPDLSVRQGINKSL